MVWLFGAVVAASVSLYVGLRSRDTNAAEGAPAFWSSAPQGHPAPSIAEPPELPDGPLSEEDVSRVSERILSVADTWMDRQLSPAAPTDPVPGFAIRPLAIVQPTETTKGIESFVQCLNAQGCIAEVRIMRATAEGVTAYGMATSYPAQVPVEVDLFVVVADSAETIRTVSLNLPLDSTPHVVPARPGNEQSR